MRRHRSPGSRQAAAARRAGVGDARVLAALAAVPRARFAPPEAGRHVDDDRPVTIGEGQTTSQPSLIAVMLEALELTGDERVLEIGTGLGYQTALLAQLAAEVVSIERLPSLAAQARRNLADLGIAGVEVVVGDGSRGVPEHAPYDAIVVSAAAASLPQVADQLVPGGRLVVPVGRGDVQWLEVHTVREGRLERIQQLMRVRFVPLVPGDAS